MDSFDSRSADNSRAMPSAAGAGTVTLGLGDQRVTPPEVLDHQLAAPDGDPDRDLARFLLPVGDQVHHGHAQLPGLPRLVLATYFGADLR